MKQISVDADFSKKLSELTGQAFLCDSEGRVLGSFSPLPGHPRIDELQLEPPSSIERLQELRKVKTGKPLEEILKRHGL